MNCPKCGFVQEERADCRKCGVVIAKFLALRAQETPPAPETRESLPAPDNRPEEYPTVDTPLLLDIRQTLKNLQQRFQELEFEKAERRRVRGELHALDMRLQDVSARLAARQDEIEHAAKLAEHPPAPTLQDFAALKMEVRAMDATGIYRRIDRMEVLLQSLAQDLAAKADSQESFLLTELDQRLREAEGRIEALADAKAAGLGENALAQLDTALSSFSDLKSALHGVTIRYSEIGELKKNQLVLRDMVESLQHAAETAGKEAANGGNGRMAELEKEVSALKAEVRKAYEHLELLDSHATSAASAPPSVSLEAVETLRRDLADMAGNRAQESEQMHSEMAALGLKVRECLQTLAQLPEGMESFADQMLRIDQQYQPLLPALDQMSSATSEITQKMADLGRDYALLQEEFHQAHDRIRALEDRFDGMNPRQQADADNALPVDMYCIRKNLDEIRDFMADLSRKL